MFKALQDSLPRLKKQEIQDRLRRTDFAIVLDDSCRMAATETSRPWDHLKDLVRQLSPILGEIRKDGARFYLLTKPISDSSHNGIKLLESTAEPTLESKNADIGPYLKTIQSSLFVSGSRPLVMVILTAAPGPNEEDVTITNPLIDIVCRTMVDLYKYGPEGLSEKRVSFQFVQLGNSSEVFDVLASELKPWIRLWLFQPGVTKLQAASGLGNFLYSEGQLGRDGLNHTKASIVDSKTLQTGIVSSGDIAQILCGSWEPSLHSPHIFKVDE